MCSGKPNEGNLFFARESRRPWLRGDDRNRTGVQVRSLMPAHRPFVGEYIYVIRAGDGQEANVKIGWTTDPAGRVRSLQCGNARPLSLESFVPGDRDFERRLHRILDDDRLTGEWFRRSPRVELVCEASLHLWGHPKDHASPLSRVLLDVRSAKSLRQALQAFDERFAELETEAVRS